MSSLCMGKCTRGSHLPISVVHLSGSLFRLLPVLSRLTVLATSPLIQLIRSGGDLRRQINRFLAMAS